jgi:hypothetical protein
MRMYLAIAAILALCACTPMTAEAPLFSPADQDPGFAPEAGLWVARDEGCSDDPQKHKPGDGGCIDDWMRLTRLPDGAWEMREAGGDDDDGPVRFFAAAATPAQDGRRAALFVVEGVTAEGEINYMAVAPRGDRDGPITRLQATLVECDIAQAPYAPIEGVRLIYKDGRVNGCIASSKEAVREAARRAVLETLNDFGAVELVYVRP